jgi:hypothetical protein
VLKLPVYKKKQLKNIHIPRVVLGTYVQSSTAVVLGSRYDTTYKGDTINSKI